MNQLLQKVPKAQKVPSKLNLLLEHLSLQNRMELYILYVDQQNNDTQVIEDKISDIKYSSSKYKNFFDKKQKKTKEIIDDNTNVNTTVNNNEKIDLYNDK